MKKHLTVGSTDVLVLVVAAALTMPLGWVHAFPPEKPYDPRPLMAEAERKLKEDKYSFVVMGDVKGSSAFTTLVARAEILNPTFVLLTGDMVSTGSSKLYDHLERQMGRFMRRIPTWPCVGNHELGRLEGWPLYKQFFGIRDWLHYFDFRNARFIIINKPDALHGRAAEQKWLADRLAEGRKEGRLQFVLHHCPSFSVGIKRRREVPGVPTSYTKLLTRYGVVADFSGHEHTYYRTFRDGVTYITQGVGGARIYTLNRRNEAIPGDAYYGGLPDGGTLMHTPSGERKFKGSVFMLTEIRVDGTNVTGRTIAWDGGIMDEFTLLPRPQQAEGRSDDNGSEDSAKGKSGP